ncbi:Asp23/Gls24 family envelope stress response protein [Nonomuraea fuscirosea]|uniref:Asp23/Gls24 family envelope stress response protein n=1 Tax=Nonomuraea fuscirosea TaxID=1291556 RepID=UPI00342BAB56
MTDIVPGPGPGPDTAPGIGSSAASGTGPGAAPGVGPGADSGVAPDPVAGGVVVPSQRPAPLPSPERRGRTEISDRVITKIACSAAMEVPEVRDVRLRGLPWSRASSGAVHGGQVSLRLNVSVGYPSPLRAVATRLREHVTRRIAAQTGLDVTRLDITMTDLGGDLP